MSATQAAINALFAGDGAGSAADAAGALPPTAKHPERTRPVNLDHILHISVTVNVTLAQRALPIESILALHVGSIVEFDKPFDSELSLCIGNREIGRGQAVKVGENFGLRISTIETVRQRLDAMSARPSR